MDKHTKAIFLNMSRQDLWEFVLEWRDKNDHTKLEQQSFALDLLLEITEELAYDEGKRSTRSL